MNIKRDITIHHLFQRPEFKPMLARWFIEEWRPWYGRRGPGDAQKDLDACDGMEEIPICLIALDERERLLGTVALKERSVGFELGVGPWLAALLVDARFQGRGVGPVLIEAVAGEAQRLGYDRIYTSGQPDDHVLEQQGWSPYGETESLRGPLVVYERVLCESIAN